MNDAILTFRRQLIVSLRVTASYPKRLPGFPSRKKCSRANSSTTRKAPGFSTKSVSWRSITPHELKPRYSVTTLTRLSL